MMPIKGRRRTIARRDDSASRLESRKRSLIRLELVVPVHPLHYYPVDKHGIHAGLHART